MGVRSVVLGLSVLLAASHAEATPIVFTLTTSGGSGYLGAASFSQAEVTFVATGNTDNYQVNLNVPYLGGHFGPSYYSYSDLPLDSLSITVAGLPKAVVLLPSQLTSENDVRLAVSTGFDIQAVSGTAGPSFADIVSNYSFAGQVGGSNPFAPAATTQGLFSVGFVPASYPPYLPATFSAVLGTPVLEPSSLAMAGTGLLGLVLALRRKVARTA